MSMERVRTDCKRVVVPRQQASHPELTADNTPHPALCSQHLLLIAASHVSRRITDNTLDMRFLDDVEVVLTWLLLTPN
jgi:hypothetical protein